MSRRRSPSWRILQSSMALLDRPVEVIDLRLAGRMVVRPYPSAAAVPTTGKNSGASAQADQYMMEAPR